MSQDNFFREVDEELRSDRMRQLWRRFGPFLIGAMVVVVLAVAVNEGWSWWQNSQSAEKSDHFYAALELADNGDVAGAQAALDEIVASGGGYATLASFKQAALLAKDGETAEAVAAYDALANTETNPRLRELALVFSANLLVDGGDVAAVEQRVGGLVSPENPLRNAAREALGLAQYKAGLLEDARESFEAVIADPMTAPELQSRMQVYLAQLAAEGAVPPETDAAEVEAPAGGEPAAEEAAAPEGVEAGAN